MDRDDDLGTVGDELLNLVGIDIGIVGIAVGKNYLSTLADKSQRRRHEGIGRYDDLVARLHIAQDGCHL